MEEVKKEKRRGKPLGNIPVSEIKTLAAYVEEESWVSAFFSKGRYFIVLRLRRELSTWEPEVKRLVEVFGGSYARSNKDHSWWFNLMGIRAMLVLEMLYPYLSGKRPHVELCRELYARMTNKHRGKALPPKEHELRREILAKLKRLNSGK